MSSRRLLTGLLAVILGVAIGSAGFMAGYADGQSSVPVARVQLSPGDIVPSAAAPNAAAPTAKPSPATTDIPSTATTPNGDPSLQVFWEYVHLLQTQYYGDDVPQGQDLAYAAIRGVTFSLKDQFTSFIPPATTKIIEEDSTGEFSGIGAYVQLDPNRALRVTRIFAESPAAKAGLVAGDLIISVNGESIVGEDLYAQIAKVRGPAGTEAKLTVVRGDEKPFDVTVVRATIKIPLVESKMINGDIAYVRLSSFDSSTTSQQLNDAIDQVLLRNPKGLVFDLRDNPGGFLDQSIQVADIFLKDGVVLYERTKPGPDQQEQVWRSTEKGSVQDLPLVVLINGGSASAAEIVAGAIQDRGRGKLIGVKSFGKGSVQQIEHLSDGSQARITIAHWFTPNNREIHGKGLDPDIVVAAGTEPAKDPQLDRAVEYLTKGQ